MLKHIQLCCCGVNAQPGKRFVRDLPKIVVLYGKIVHRLHNGCTTKTNLEEKLASIRQSDVRHLLWTSAVLTPSRIPREGHRVLYPRDCEGYTEGVSSHA